MLSEPCVDGVCTVEERAAALHKLMEVCEACSEYSASYPAWVRFACPTVSPLVAASSPVAMPSSASGVGKKVHKDQSLLVFTFWSMGVYKPTDYNITLNMLQVTDETV